ncbi:N5-carboxyaminoimidazole ribonucleotide synthase [Thalassoglobus neptunius]|uniref:N5-carboxyaminoimidazole ribonucleotide synthase n=1 Tax=Thalassoglobus neptunius TaxID=1938619 RepID=A0A5C5WYL6_9PLAN|nr:5-(carboxyamino)imidazole ribonucleotide synthase [Thalassoglobus neptunius]TWT55787.1 N5-carboxyaminoimidazole ribonucleotide synthase [Thalassoglobus neptunius]
MLTEISPGSVLGVLGSGQLGRMFAIEARRLGYRVHVFSPDKNTPAGAVADAEWCAEYEDFDALDDFAKSVDVVTLEFENVSTQALNRLERFVPVRPGPQVLEVAQNRLAEKTQMQKFGLATAPFKRIDSLPELESSLQAFGGQGILKTASWGYDGKGQKFADSNDDLEAIWSTFEGQPAILEGVVDFQRELSVIGVRDSRGNFISYAPIVNEHSNHILDFSSSATGLVDQKLVDDAGEIARTVMESLDATGVLCVELFETSDGQLLVNEIAPRPHNSGHLTIDAHLCCQFQQQVRSICNLPLGSTAQRQPAAMVNLLGDLWPDGGQPEWSRVLGTPNLRVHLYGKDDAKLGRKMGHMTAVDDTIESARNTVKEAREALA